MKCQCLLLIFALLQKQSYTAGFYEYMHSLERNRLLDQERQFAGWNTTLNEDEEIVNDYLEYLKWQEFQKTRDAFIPSRPVQDYLAQIQTSEVFKVLKKFPKGGSLHLHHYHVVSKSILLDIIINSSIYDNLYFRNGDPDIWFLDFFVNPPEGWLNVKNYSKDDSPIGLLLPHLLFTTVMDDKAKGNPTDSAIRWQELTPLFDRLGSNIINHANITRKHMEAMLKSALDENVQYLETKSSVSRKLYVLDATQTETYGKRYTDNNSGEMELEAVDSVVKDFIMKHPEFIGYKRVISSNRGASKDRIRSDLNKTVNLQQKYPQLIAGYDLAAEEDRGYSLMFFQEEFLSLLEAHQKLPYFFHAGETNWPDDLLTSMHPEDPFSTPANLYDAIVLGTKRIGHGIALANHPYLMEVLKSKNIAIEANPVSNMMLGYVQDQRHHPAITYFRYGVPVVISADDPATFGYDSFTIDWYEAFMAWGLNLADLRQLANNSLQYSAMSAEEKSNAYAKWINAWNKFIQETKKEACDLHVNGTQPFIASIFPNEGYVSGNTKVMVFGRNFEHSICQTVLCKFGNRTSTGQYVTNNLITCNYPDMPTLGAPSQANSHLFSISFNNGSTFYSTNITFTLIDPFMTTPGTPSQTNLTPFSTSFNNGSTPNFTKTKSNNGNIRTEFWNISVTLLCCLGISIALQTE
ncbi:hypothetical protein CHS0354_004672 [Potamilus streckersoni]|uniref:adenosine deaminase n=1 Tax=Potamilus streckersoni TaxID=2493646 RepID=A0AAE0TAB2_9BIVA|nr:hypothetical protein CHS0354_004672 [Potamilus streckersoni]